MISIRSFEDVEALLADGVQEGLHLDMKDSRALLKEKREEVAKDIAAFANSDGGVLLYGIKETKKLGGQHFELAPFKLQAKLSHVSSEWIERVAASNIEPRIRGLESQFFDVPNEKGRIFVIRIPKGSSAHQGPDKVYRQRVGDQNLAMPHHAVLDVLRRGEVAEVECFAACMPLDGRFRFQVGILNTSGIVCRDWKLHLKTEGALEVESPTKRTSQLHGPLFPNEVMHLWSVDTQKGRGITGNDKIVLNVHTESTPRTTVCYQGRDVAELKIVDGWLSVARDGEGLPDLVRHNLDRTGMLMG